MSKHYDRQRKLQQQVLDKLNMVVDSTVRNKSDLSNHLKRLKTYVWDSEAYGRLTRYNRAYIQGYYDARMGTIQRELQEWRLYYKGQFITDRDKIEDWSAVESGRFFWIDNPGDKFIDREWSINDAI